LQILDRDVVLRVLRLLRKLRYLDLQRLDFSREIFFVRCRTSRRGISQHRAEQPEQQQHYQSSISHIESTSPFWLVLAREEHALPLPRTPSGRVSIAVHWRKACVFV